MNSDTYNILIIKGSSQYDVLRHVCDEITIGFRDHGCHVSELDLTRFSYSNLSPNMLNGYDILFSFDEIGADIYNFVNYKPFFWTFLVDHPFYLHERLKLLSGNVMVSCVDRRHVDYIDKFYKNISYTCFMPHGGITGTVPSPIPFDDRKYNVSFLGSLGRLNDIKEVIHSLHEEYDNFIDEIVESVMADMSIDLETVIYDTLTDFDISFDSQSFTELTFSFRAIDALRRFFKRSSMICSLVEAGLNIDIWGNGWEQLPDYNGRRDLLHIHGMADYLEAKSIMHDSRFVLCDMPLFHDGSHERIFAAMQAHAIALTDKSLFLEEIFTDKENIIFYDIDEISTLASTLNKITENNSTANSIIKNAHSIAKEHTWRHRTSEMVEIITNLTK